MKENTFTYTARSAIDPDKMATFTFYNGSVSIELGNALIEQAGDAFEATTDEEVETGLKTWIKPAATGALQKLLEPPTPLADFDAEINGEALQTTAWIRAGGLRLAPVMMTWQKVDNPAGAEAFVNELRERKDVIRVGNIRPAPLDYWVSWVVIGLIVIISPILFIRRWQQTRAS